MNTSKVAIRENTVDAAEEVNSFAFKVNYVWPLKLESLVTNVIWVEILVKTLL